MSEGSGALWRYVKGKLLDPLDVHATRIESPCSPGFPDVHYHLHSVSGTIELKFLRKKNLPFGDDGLNREQRAWHREAVRHKCKALILADVNDVLYLIPGQWAQQFNDATSLEFMSAWIARKRRLSDQDLHNFYAALVSG